MTLNWLVIPTLALALLLFRAGQALFARAVEPDFTPRRRALLLAALFAAALAAALPGILIALYYLVHGRGFPAWFYAFRALPGSELTAAGAGLMAGVLAGWTLRLSVRRTQARRATARQTFLRLFSLLVRSVLLALLLIGVAAPHVKPLLSPLREGQLADLWRDGVCLQSAPSTCGPASAASIFRTFGVALSERQLARECHTYGGGTEVWYLARAFRRRGFDVSFRCYPSVPENLPTPAIAGVDAGGGMGHFVPLLAETATSYVIGDPLPGRMEIPKATVRQRYRFSGFFMVIHKRGA